MASDIALSQAVRQNLLSLQNTADLMSRTQTRLATGNKVNSALDNPINFFTASGLNARAGELNNLQDSMSNAISTIEAADKGLTSITKMVEQMQATVRQAMQVTTEDLSFSDSAFTAPAAATADDTEINLSVVVDGQTVTMNAVTYDTGETVTAEDVVNGINDFARTAAGTGNDAAQYVRAELSDTGEISISAVGGRTLSVVQDAVTAPTTTAGASTNSLIFGQDLSAYTPTPGDNTAVNGGNIDILRTDANEKRIEFAEQYNNLREQLNDLAQDSSFNGVNLLQGDDLKVVFNELTGSQQSKMDIEGEFVDSDSLGVGKAHLWGGSYGAYNPDPLSIDFQSDSATGGLEDALSQLTSALGGLRSMAANFGSALSVVEIRSDFTQDMVNTLQSGAAKLTLADTNEEGANMLALQTRQQLSSTALSLSSQADQNVLRLF